MMKLRSALNEENLITYEVSDEALEIAGGKEIVTNFAKELSMNMCKTKSLRSVVVAGVAAFLFLVATPVWAEDAAAVKIGNFTFGPQELKVKAGTTVTWTNEDDIPHTVVSPNNFRSKALDTDGTYSFTFTAPGAYKYFCSLHPHMTGTIVVEAATGSITPQ
jgi:amicyanin